MFFNDAATTEIYTLSLHDALPISRQLVDRSVSQVDGVGDVEGPGHGGVVRGRPTTHRPVMRVPRSEEHTSELQSRQYLVCRLLLEKKKTRLYAPASAAGHMLLMQQ